MHSSVPISSLPALEQQLYAEALRARQQAYAPFSQFTVGAALATDRGDIYLGCNIENSAYGSTMCAERVAIFNYVSQRSTSENVLTMMVVAEYETPVPPCGACRQVMSELTPHATIWLSNTQGLAQSFSVTDLLPGAFQLTKD